MAGAETYPQHCGPLDTGFNHLWRHPIHATPVLPGGLVYDCPVQATSVVVFKLSAGILFRVQCVCRAVHGDFRGFLGASVFARKNG